MSESKHLHHSRRRWSQNFLKDPNIARKIADSLQLDRPALIIEVGSGRGMLTRYLLEGTDKLLCVEIDPLLAEMLPESLDNPLALKVINEDFMEWDFSETIKQYPDHYKGIIGNLPYHITSPILFKTLEQVAHLKQAVFMIQKEVAQRITASPGSKVYGILSVFSQLYAKVEYLFTIPAHLFSPAPRVDSGVIRFSFIPDAESQLLNTALFKEIVRHTFGQRRKMLRNTLSALYPHFILEQLIIDLTRRPESLSVDEFVNLSNQLQKIQKRS
jgi:16S rRNA (adenine1518-N6/adenine1519-N6)-dimethyltransferase